MSFLVPFAFVLLAELGDKTMLTVLLLASKTRKHFLLWAGVMAAFALVDGASIFIGAAAPRLIPVSTVKIVLGILFIMGGLYMLLSKEKEGPAEVSDLKNPFLLGFVMIFTAELGDKTQIASGIFGARFPVLPVLAGTLTALGLLSALSIAAGSWLSSKIPGAKLQKAAAVIFIVMGIFCFIF